MPSSFSPEFFKFLTDLKRHNDRTWFADNKDRYVRDVEAPMLQFIEDFAPHLKKISPAYVADKRRMGGSMFRIYRDTRFSADKLPFKTWMAARFPHEARKKVPSVPAFYLHLDPKEGYGGGGVYHIETPALTRIRERIVNAPRDWQAVLESGIKIEGESLKRAPAGFDPKQKYLEDLKRKNIYTLTEFTPADAVKNNFFDKYVESCERAAPLLEFLTKALGLRW